MDLVTGSFSGFTSNLFGGIWSSMPQMEPWEVVLSGSVFSLCSHVFLLRMLPGAEWDAQLRLKEGPLRQRGFMASIIIRLIIMCLYTNQLLFLIPAVSAHVARCLFLIGPADGSILIGSWTATWVARNMWLAWLDSVLHPHLAVLSGACVVPDTVLKAFLLPFLHGVFSHSLQSQAQFSCPPLCLAASFCLRNAVEHLRWLEHPLTGQMGSRRPVGLVSVGLWIHLGWAYTQGHIGGVQGLAALLYGAVYGLNNHVHVPQNGNLNRRLLPGRPVYKTNPFYAASFRNDAPVPCDTIAEDPDWTMGPEDEEADSSGDDEDVELSEIAGLAIDAVTPLTDLLGQGYEIWCAQISRSQPAAIDPDNNQSVSRSTRSRSRSCAHSVTGASTSRQQSLDVSDSSSHLSESMSRSRSRSRAGTPSSLSSTPARDSACLPTSHGQRRISTFYQILSFVFLPITALGFVAKCVFSLGANVRRCFVNSCTYVWSRVRLGSGAVGVGADGVNPVFRPRRLQRDIDGEWGRTGDKVVQVDCRVCWGAKSVWTVLDCGHLCLCTECASRLAGLGHTRCPICREEVKRIVFTHY